MTFLQEFDKRNEDKKIIHTNESNVYINEKEIWYVKLGINVGFEENGKNEFLRPVLVMKKTGNLFYCIPLTTKGKENNRFYHKVSSINFGKDSYLILSQAKVIDKKRFIRIVQNGVISKDEFINIQKLLKDIYLPGA